MMTKRLLFLYFVLVAIPSSTTFAWYEHGNDSYWNYHGSGRDYAYSQYIDDYYSLGFAPVDSPNVPLFAGAVYFNNASAPVLTPASQIIAPPPLLPPPPPEAFTVNIPNNHGSYTPVVIVRSGNGWIGPQGEYYTQFPSVALLRVLYGK